MDLAQLKRLTRRVRKQNEGRRPLPREMHKALEGAADDLIRNIGEKAKQIFIERISEPGYEPTLFECYVIRRMIEQDES